MLSGPSETKRHLQGILDSLDGWHGKVLALCQTMLHGNDAETDSGPETPPPLDANAVAAVSGPAKSPSKPIASKNDTSSKADNTAAATKKNACQCHS